MFKGQEMYSLSYLAFLGLHVLFGVSETPVTVSLTVAVLIKRAHRTVAKTLYLGMVYLKFGIV